VTRDKPKTLGECSTAQKAASSERTQEAHEELSTGGLRQAHVSGAATLNAAVCNVGRAIAGGTDIRRPAALKSFYETAAAAVQEGAREAVFESTSSTRARMKVGESFSPGIISN
jgi:hypothetical protein